MNSTKENKLKIQQVIAFLQEVNAPQYSLYYIIRFLLDIGVTNPDEIRHVAFKLHIPNSTQRRVNTILSNMNSALEDLCEHRQSLMVESRIILRINYNGLTSKQMSERKTAEYLILDYSPVQQVHNLLFHIVNTSVLVTLKYHRCQPTPTLIYLVWGIKYLTECNCKEVDAAKAEAAALAAEAAAKKAAEAAAAAGSAGKKNLCVACLCNPVEMAIVPCGHYCLCKECALNFGQNTTHENCPNCRGSIKSIMKIYM